MAAVLLRWYENFFSYHARGIKSRASACEKGFSHEREEPIRRQSLLARARFRCKIHAGNAVVQTNTGNPFTWKTVMGRRNRILVLLVTSAALAAADEREEVAGLATLHTSNSDAR